MRKLVPFLVNKHMIKYDVYSLDAWDGFMIGPNRVADDVFLVEFEKRKYGDVLVGEVFMVDDPDGVYACDEPSCFLLKQEFGDWYLTTDRDKPLGIDRGKYDDVWVVETW
jgi:hypothetical protein